MIYAFVLYVFLIYEFVHICVYIYIYIMLQEIVDVLSSDEGEQSRMSPTHQAVKRRLTFGEQSFGPAPCGASSSSSGTPMPMSREWVCRKTGQPRRMDHKGHLEYKHPRRGWPSEGVASPTALSDDSGSSRLEEAQENKEPKAKAKAKELEEPKAKPKPKAKEVEEPKAKAKPKAKNKPRAEEKKSKAKENKELEEPTKLEENKGLEVTTS